MTIYLDKRVEELKSEIDDMKDVFRFEIGIGVSSDPVGKLWVEIPMALHDRICAQIGTDKISRYEFGFHFQERVEHDFPELDRTIQLAIHDWGKTIDMKDIPKNLLKVYHLFSSWFEE